jgi:hypothetical protein
MTPSRTLAVIVLLLSYGAVGARQPAVRSAVPLPVPAHDLAAQLGLASADRSRIVLDIVRLVFDAKDGEDVADTVLRNQLRQILAAPSPPGGETVPLPLDPSIWRDTLLERQTPDGQLIAAILSDRRTALLYHGLAALDDETLAWLGPDRETLRHLRQHAGAFAVFGRSVRVNAGRVLVPGGPDAEAAWQTLTGADPARPAAFVRRLFKDSGRLAFMYDTVAHLDPARQHFALGTALPPASRAERLRALLDAFEIGRIEWNVEMRPFSRRPLDAAVVLSLVSVTERGEPRGPMTRQIWTRVFHDSDETSFSETAPLGAPNDADSQPVDAAWLAARISGPSYDTGRHRLDTLLFAQRVFGDAPAADPALVVTALRGFTAFPSLMLIMERIGTTSASALVRAARHAADLDAIKSDDAREAAILQFQAAMGIVERARRSGFLSREAVEAVVLSLTSLPVTRSEGYDTRLAAWIRSDLMPRLSKLDLNVSPLCEEAVLAAMAGWGRVRNAVPVIEWEGQRYAVDPPAAELRRLRRVRERQGGLTLDAALAAVLDGKPAGQRGRERNPRALLTETLVSLLYAAHLGNPEGQALQAGDVARRHTLTTVTRATGGRDSDAWMLPREQFSAKGWRVGGSLLGLETALGRLAVRRLDSSTMPLEPRLSTNERHTLMLTAALMNPAAVTDATRDEIAAAIARGRARATALKPDRAEVERVARAAGLSEWRREALAWALTHDPSTVVSRFSILELFWLGVPRPAVRASLDDWGVAVLNLTGCLCLEMPAAIPWEERTGRPATGQLATRGADVALQVADLLASLHLPASLAPGVVAYAMQDVADQAQPSHFDDWDDFSRAVRDLPRERLIDYISALAADGPLMPMTAPSGLP